MNELFLKSPTLLASMIPLIQQLLPSCYSVDRLVLILPGTKGGTSLRLSVIPTPDGSWDSYQLVCERCTIKAGSGQKLDVYVEYPVSSAAGVSKKSLPPLAIGRFFDRLSTQWTKVLGEISLSSL